MLRSLAAAIVLLLGHSALAGPLPDEIEGWSITRTEMGWQELGTKLDEAIEASPLNKLSQASATMGAKQALDQDIAGNKVVHAFAPQFAVRMLETSIAAGIEAPFRFYIVENPDGGSSLAYETPSHVWEPYEDGGEALDELAQELDGIMEEIAAQATGS